MIKKLLKVGVLYSCLLIASLNSFGQGTLQNGLVADYPFNDNGTSTVTDVFHGYNGTKVSGVIPTTDRFCNANSAYDFSSTNTSAPPYIDLGSTNVKVSGNQISISVWVKFINDGANWGRIFLGGSVNYQYTLCRYEDGNGNNKIYFRPITSNGNGDVYTTTSLSRTDWHHVVAVYDGSSSIIYIDGSSLKYQTSGVTGTLLPNTNTSVIGGETGAHGGGGPASIFGGLIDDLKIYNRALTASEVDQLHTLNPVVPLATPVFNPAALTSINAGQTATFTINAVPGATSYQWTLNGAVVQSSSLLSYSYSSTSADAGTTKALTVEAVNACGTSSLLSTSFTINATSLQNGLLADYPFNDNGTSTVTDVFHGYNGTKVSGVIPTTDRFCNANSAYDFSSTNTSAPPYIDLGSTNVKVSGNQISISVWVKFINDGANWGRIFLGGSVNYQYTLCRYEDGNGNNKIYFRPITSNGNGDVYTTTSLSRTDWHHVVAVYDGSSSIIYIDGSSLKYQTSGVTGTLLPNTNTSVIGGETGAHGGGGPASIFGGLIDDLKIYNRALTASEVDQLHTLNPVVPLATPVFNPAALTSINAGQTATFTINAVPGATSYQWTLNGAVVQSSSLLSYSYSSTSADAGTTKALTVEAVNACGTSSLLSTSFTVNSLCRIPTINYVSIPPPGGFCQGGVISLVGYNNNLRVPGDPPYTINLQAYDGTNYITVLSSVSSSFGTFFYYTINGNYIINGNLQLRVTVDPEAVCATTQASNPVYLTGVSSGPATPTASYLWCDNIGLQLTASSATPGVSYTWKDITNGSSQLTSLGTIIYTATPAPTVGDNFTVVASKDGCLSSVVSINNLTKSYLPTPVITYFGYGAHLFNNPSGSYYIQENGTWFNLSSNYYSNYQWYADALFGINYISLSSQTNQTLNLRSLNNNAAAFVVKQTNQCGTGTSSPVKVYINAIYPARESFDESNIDANAGLLYPNPTSKELNINAPYDTYTISISNVFGDEVLSKQVSQNRTKVDLSSLSAGSYVVKLISVEGTITKQIQVVK